MEIVTLSLSKGGELFVCGQHMHDQLRVGRVFFVNLYTIDCGAP
jgi:hypothetical protein